MHIGLLVKCPLFSDCNETLIFAIFSKNSPYKISWKSIQWDGQTDMTKLLVASRNLANRPQNRIKATDTIFQMWPVIETGLSDKKKEIKNEKVTAGKATALRYNNNNNNNVADDQK
jgi:hypothetical protein